MALSAAAEDLDAVYAFLDYCFEPEPAGRSIDGGSEGKASYGGHGYNSAVLGADKFASAQYAEVFASVYPGDSLANLWPWPKEPQWYADVRTELPQQVRQRLIGRHRGDPGNAGVPPASGPKVRNEAKAGDARVPGTEPRLGDSGGTPARAMRVDPMFDLEFPDSRCLEPGDGSPLSREWTIMCRRGVAMTENVR